MHSARSMRGATLLESLIALVLVSLGVLALLSALLASLHHAQAGTRRAVAVRLIGDLSERLRANPQAPQHIDAYIHASDDDSHSATPPDCTAPCAASAWAHHDAREWMQHVRSGLGRNQALIFQSDAPGPEAQRRIGILLAWPHKGRYGGSSTAHRLNAWAGAITTRGSGHSCPAGWDCHVQYLLLAPRCSHENTAASHDKGCPT